MIETPTLPQGWISVELQDVATISTGRTPNPKNGNNYGGAIPFVTPGDLVGGVVDKTERGLTEEGLEAAVMLPAGSVCVSCIGNLGKVGLLGVDGASNQQINSIIPNHHLNNRFLLHWAKTITKWLEENSSATTIRIINKGRFSKAPLYLPPLNEQRRIADKIDALQAKSRRAREALETVKPLLEKFRQSVLAAAFRGDLTAEWRKQNPDVEPASKLLERIRAERRARWEEAELAKMQAKGVKPKNDKWKEKYEEPAPVDTEGLPELPEGWCWCRLAQLIYDGPTNGFSPKSSDDATGSLSLKLSATTSGHFIANESTIKRLCVTVDPESKFWLRSGDLLIQRANSIEYLGSAAIYTGDDNTFIFPDLMMRVRTATPNLAIWLQYWFNSHLGKRYVKGNATGTAGNMPKINGKTVQNALLPVPPFSELRIAVQSMSEIDTYSSQLSTTVSSSTKQTISLDQSILAKAFRGELVPQDPNDEPASVLLKRIKAEREATPGKKKRGRKAS